MPKFCSRSFLKISVVLLLVQLIPRFYFVLTHIVAAEILKGSLAFPAAGDVAASGALNEGKSFSITYTTFMVFLHEAVLKELGQLLCYDCLD